MKKEMAHLRNTHEMEISDLKRQISVSTQSKQGVERTLDDTKERVQAVERYIVAKRGYYYVDMAQNHRV